MSDSETKSEAKKTQGSPDITGAPEAGGIVDAHRGKGPHVVPFVNDSQDNQGTQNLQESSFGEIGQTLEGMKDSPLDQKIK